MWHMCHETQYIYHNTYIQPIAFGVLFNLNRQSQFYGSLFYQTRHKRPRERDQRLRFEMKKWHFPNAIGCIYIVSCWTWETTNRDMTDSYAQLLKQRDSISQVEHISWRHDSHRHNSVINWRSRIAVRAREGRRQSFGYFDNWIVFVVVCCSVSQCVAVCCSVLQCVASAQAGGGSLMAS